MAILCRCDLCGADVKTRDATEVVVAPSQAAGGRAVADMLEGRPERFHLCPSCAMVLMIRLKEGRKAARRGERVLPE